MSATQLTLLDAPPRLPEGVRYRADVNTPAQEHALVARFAELDFREFEFQGYRGKRRTISFGLHYDFQADALRKAAEIPAFLLPLRAVAAGFAAIDPNELRHALVIEYAPGAGIGWHRDRPVFGDVIGISLLSACRFRMRRQQGSDWERATLVVEPRSVYLLRGLGRTEWEHSIPPGERLRYSVTFRTLRQ